MTNVIVVSFQEETKAMEALHKLNELESLGDISVYEKIMIRKKANGESEILKEDSSEGWRILTGMGVGSLLGMLGGPIGFVVGLYTGTAVGAIADASHYDFAEDFIARVENKLQAGTTSIIAEVDEDSNVFIDTYLKPLGAVITRSDVDFEFDKYENEQLDELDEEMANERAAFKEARKEDRKKIQKKIAELKEKRKEKIAEFVAEAKTSEKNIQDKTTAGIAKVKSDMKEFGTSISNKVKEEREDRIKRRIARHEERLKDLNKQLKELQVLA
ncbi:MAG TPA: DUF1269 domain-containing protein [Chitinophagaceae bacterium]|nr:DUF1269 domain-containing protein [Chitinophagaceae bacterium]